MAEAPSPQTDRDLASIAEARALARRAKQAWLELAEFSQEKIDAIVDAMAAAATPQAEAFARLAVEETGYGVVADSLANRVSVLYTDRGPFREYGVLTQALATLGRARHVPREPTPRDPPGALGVRHVSREVKTLFPADLSNSRNLLELCKCILNGIMLGKI